MMMNTIMNEAVKNPAMTLITKAQMAKLVKAGEKYESGNDSDSIGKPIVKLFGGSLTWLVTHIESSGLIFGYADMGFQCVEFGALCHLSDLPTMKTGIAYLERDRWWKSSGKNPLLSENLIGI
jgi:hypothetical protein